MLYIFAALLGFFAGLSVDYLADVLPTRSKWGRPVCSHCGTEREWRDYFTLSPCRACKVPRHWRSVITLIAGVTLSLALWTFPPLKWGYWYSFLILTFLGLVIIIDIEHHLILHPVTLVGAILGFIIGSLTNGFLRTLLGGIIGFIFMLIFYLLGILFARFRARRLGLDPSDEEALGFGDVTISGVLGLLLGFLNVLYGLITGILLAGLFSIVLMGWLLLTKKFKSGNIYIPYGPFLILGACVYLFFR